MRFVIQRVNHANVKIDGEVVGNIGHGLLILFGAVMTIQKKCFQNMQTRYAKCVFLKMRMCRERVPKVETGRFGADMKVSLENDGPFTILIDSEDF